MLILTFEIQVCLSKGLEFSKASLIINTFLNLNRNR